MLDAARQRAQPVVRVLKARDEPSTWARLKPARSNEEAMLEGERLLVAIPLAIKAEHFGVLLLEEAPGGRRFRARRLEIINGIAQQAALAIQSDRLQGEMVVRERLETEVNLARQIQRAFIPQSLPELKGWQLAGRWETARQVGGDFYDVITLPGRKVGLFIGDVADKGMPAALFMALTMTLVRAAVMRTNSPAEALQQVNDLLIPDTSLGMFVTAAYGVLDLDTYEFTYANAGHNPPVWMRRDGRIELLTRTGIALGIIEAGAISERTIRLAEGESVLLYTDGITEAFSPSGDMFGDQRLLDALRRAAGRNATGMLDLVEAEVKDFMGSLPLSDDMTMLLVKRD
jgi:serine phosphatase RsbU (regulator of sigma subunit)